MKKFYFILILLIIIFLFNKSEKVIAVFGENNYYEIYYLDFRDSNLNTNNFLEYFNNENIDVLKIEPYINPIYKNKIEFDEYLFDYTSKSNNIKRFKETFLKKLKLINYDDYIKNNINGIKINMVKVYSNEKEIIKLLKKDKNVKYVFNYSDYSKV